LYDEIQGGTESVFGPSQITRKNKFKVKKKKKKKKRKERYFLSINPWKKKIDP
jgi:hypothetical protein